MPAPIETPVQAPVRTPEVGPEPLTRMNPDRLCPAQKEKVTREIERVI